MMNNTEFDGFAVNIFLDEDSDWMAHFVELPNVSAFGSTPEEALCELHHAWEAMKESYRKHNEMIPVPFSKRQFSGRFNIRIDKRLHKSLVQEAFLAGISLNALVSEKLAQSIKV